MKMKYVLLEYDYTTYCQGTADHNTGTALIHCPKDATFSEVRSTLINTRQISGEYEIDIKSVKNATIEW